MPASLAPGESPLPDLETAAFSLCPHGQRGGERESMHICVHHVGSSISLFSKFFVLQAVVRKNMENSSAPFVQFLLMVTYCKTVVQHHNQNVHINTVYPVYSDNPSFTFTWTVCVCTCVWLMFS